MSIYSILALTSGIFVLFCGFLVLAKNKKSKLNQIFFLFTVTVAIWLLATFLMLLSKTDEQAIFWDRIVYVGVVFIPTTFYHFTLVFTKTKNQKRLLYLGYLLSFLFLILSRTNYFVEDLYKYSWGVHTQARFFHHIFLVFFASYICLAFLNIYRYHRQVKDIERRQAAYILLVIFIIVLNSLAFLPAYNINISPFFSYSLPIITILILSFAIIKYHLFEIRVILTEILVGVMGIILFVLPFLMPSFNLKILTFFIFILFLVFGYLLIKSTYQEIKRIEELERISQAKTEFISITSHQLRTPLSAIKGYLSMVLEGSFGEVSEKAKKALEKVYQSNERLIRVVNTFLDVSKIEMGKEELNLEKTSLEDLISEVIFESEPKAKDKNLYLKFEKPKISFPKILVDRQRIREALTNIIDNAIRYTQKGGINIKLESANKRVRIIIADTGEGLTKEEISKIFEKFSRGTAGTKFWVEGVGLGLYLARKFVELHGGKIWAESEGKGKGSTFYIELPIK